MKADWLDRTLIKNPLYYGLCLTEKQFASELRRLGITEQVNWIRSTHADATTHFLTNAANGAYCAVVCVRISQGRNPVEIVGLLVHEAMHIWQEIKERIGEIAPSQEFEAYSVQWIAQQLVDSCAKQMKRRRK